MIFWGAVILLSVRFDGRLFEYKDNVVSVYD